MPTLDDAPIVETLVSAGIASDDLIQIYDVSDQKAKTFTVGELIAYIVANTSATAV